MINYGSIAQWIEHRPSKPAVVGSSPTRPAISQGGGMVDARDLKSLVRKSVWVRIPSLVPIFQYD